MTQEVDEMAAQELLSIGKLARLRDLDVPLARIRPILEAAEAGVTRRQLEAHLAATMGEIWKLQRILYRLR